MRRRGYWLAWGALALGTVLFLYGDHVVRTTELDGGTSERSGPRELDWGPVACSIESGRRPWRSRASYHDWSNEIRDWMSDGPEPGLESEYYFARGRLDRIEKLNSIGWCTVLLAAAGVVVSAWRLWRRGRFAEPVVVLSTLALSGYFFVVRAFIEYVVFYPNRAYPLYIETTSQWHPVALGWFAWTAVAVVGHLTVLVVDYARNSRHAARATRMRR